MNSLMEVEVRLFGAFREVVPAGVCVLPVTGRETVWQLKAILGERLVQAQSKVSFDIQELIKKSALATETQVLSDGESLPFEGDQKSRFVLAILPPVCGG